MFDNIDLDRREREPADSDQRILELFREWQAAYAAAAHSRPRWGGRRQHQPRSYGPGATAGARDPGNAGLGGDRDGDQSPLLTHANWGEIEIGNDDYSPSGRLAEDAAWTKSLLADAARFCPETRSLAAPILDAPWCLSSDPCALIAQRIDAARARWDEASAECDRIGAEGKHDPASRAARHASDAATTEILD